MALAGTPDADLYELVFPDASRDSAQACPPEFRQAALAALASNSTTGCRTPASSTSLRVGFFGGGSATIGAQSFSSPVSSASFIQQQTGIDARPLISPERWLAESHGVAQTFAVQPARRLTFESSAYSSKSGSAVPGRPDALRIDSRSARLSFSPAADWVVRLSRGSVSGVDHLVAGDEIRRTAISAAYRRSFAEGDWETTLAWGRNSRKFREPTVGYLVESAFRFDGVHTMFGRVEQVGSDEIFRINESMQRQLFKMNKFTLGYSQDLRVSSALSLDAGVFISRHFVPSNMAASYGSGPTAYMMFVRVKLQ
jgi:hypothetical protein